MDNNYLIQSFTNELFGNVRVLTINNEPWFIANEIGYMLGYSNPRDAVSKHVLDIDKGVANCDTPGGVQQMTIINESGLYSLIFGSKLPGAREFTHWVTSEVLPAMRKIGFTRSMQVLDEEKQRAEMQAQYSQQSALQSGIRESEIIDMRNQMIEKIQSSNLPIETKQFFIQYDPNWEGSF